MLHRRAYVAVVLACVLGGGVAGIAYAVTLNPDDLVPTGGSHDHSCNKGEVGSADPCQTDNTTLTYYMDSNGDYLLEQVDRNVVTSVLSSMYNPTDLNVSYDSSPSFSGGAETDIVYQEGSVPGSDNGYTWCDDPTSGYECDQQYVRIEGGGHYTQGLTCHETGHAVGLTHGSYANPRKNDDDPIMKCMEKPTPAGDTLGTNNVNNINSTY
jgi:hypothetical protein